MNSKHIAASNITASPDASALAQVQLRAASVRVTPARLKVLAALLGARRAFTHQDMQDAFADLDRVTLYRALDCLIEAGLAHKIAGDDRVFRYSAGTDHLERGAVDADVLTTAASMPQQHQHSHFKCTRCAKVFCLDDIGQAGLVAGVLTAADEQARLATLRQLQAALQASLGAGFRSHDIELTIKGWCADCAH
ncbi:Fur family transcriptional regulator [Undibacterium arcticum]|uniref:Fur family transcriptional regulator n=1 Tax=Undibacterium arcticum TaxID=1762892 RepID=A0ABV7F119_9BURK